MGGFNRKKRVEGKSEGEEPSNGKKKDVKAAERGEDLSWRGGERMKKKGGGGRGNEGGVGRFGSWEEGCEILMNWRRGEGGWNEKKRDNWDEGGLLT